MIIQPSVMLSEVDIVREKRYNLRNDPEMPATHRRLDRWLIAQTFLPTVSLDDLTGKPLPHFFKDYRNLAYSGT